MIYLLFYACSPQVTLGLCGPIARACASIDRWLIWTIGGTIFMKNRWTSFLLLMWGRTLFTVWTLRWAGGGQLSFEDWDDRPVWEYFWNIAEFDSNVDFITWNLMVYVFTTINNFHKIQKSSWKVYFWKSSRLFIQKCRNLYDSDFPQYPMSTLMTVPYLFAPGKKTRPLERNMFSKKKVAGETIIRVEIKEHWKNLFIWYLTIRNIFFNLKFCLSYQVAYFREFTNLNLKITISREPLLKIIILIRIFAYFFKKSFVHSKPMALIRYGGEIRSY